MNAAMKLLTKKSLVCTMLVAWLVASAKAQDKSPTAPRPVPRVLSANARSRPAMPWPPARRPPPSPHCEREEGSQRALAGLREIWPSPVLPA
jgi:hypothetical protein